jgi:hypothetical protein
MTGSDGYSHTITGGGVLDFQAPQDGPWKGMALYQDPALTKGVDMTMSGNSPTWNVSGVAYFPNANVTFSGAVNKSNNGASCFILVVDNLLINGTGSILAHGQCDKYNIQQPSGQGRGQLVQ